MTTPIRSLLAAFLFGACLASTGARAALEENERVENAADVLGKIASMTEESIPPALLRHAHGVAVIPGVIKAGFVVGGSYGKGVLTVRDAAGKWTAPVFVKLMAGSLGWQIGAQSTDVVLVFKSAKSIDGIVKGTFTLGADAAVAAGPVGRRGEAATDTDFKAEIYSYSRSRGLFAGVSLEGSKISIDHDSDAAFYGKELRPGEIFEGKGGVPPAAHKYLQALEKAMAAH